MLLNNFYSLTELENSNDSSFKVLIHLNANHDIFKGHFPNNPVTPGVCMLQIIKELTEKIVSKKLFMNQCSNVKFMALINPEVNPDLSISLEITENTANEYKVKSTTMFDETVALKLVCNFKTI